MFTTPDLTTSSVTATISSSPAGNILTTASGCVLKAEVEEKTLAPRRVYGDGAAQHSPDIHPYEELKNES